MKHIANDSSIKELWVSRKKTKRIIAASIKMKYLFLRAQIIPKKEV